MELKERSEREKGVAELVGSWSSFINDRPQLLSFLYDIDMMPEQIVSRNAANALDSICCIYTAAEKGMIPLRLNSLEESKERLSDIAKRQEELNKFAEERGVTSL